MAVDKAYADFLAKKPSIREIREAEMDVSIGYEKSWQPFYVGVVSSLIPMVVVVTRKGKR